MFENVLGNPGFWFTAVVIVVFAILFIFFPFQ